MTKPRPITAKKGPAFKWGGPATAITIRVLDTILEALPEPKREALTMIIHDKAGQSRVHNQQGREKMTKTIPAPTPLEVSQVFYALEGICEENDCTMTNLMDIIMSSRIQDQISKQVVFIKTRKNSK